MRVSNLMSPVPVTVGPETPMLDARQIMQEHRIRHLLVTEDECLVGIVTETDFLRAFVASSALALR